MATVQMTISGTPSQEEVPLGEVRLQPQPEPGAVLPPRITQMNMPETLNVVVGPIQTPVAATVEQAANHTAAIAVNNRPLKGSELQIPANQPKTLTWTVPLEAGNNVVSVRLFDNRGGDRTLDESQRTIRVRQLPGPVVLVAPPVPVAGKAAARLSVRVTSRVLPLGLKVSINKQMPPEAIPATFVNEAQNLWMAAVDVPGLAPGKNVLDLWATTADGDSQDGVETPRVVCAPPAGNEPKVVIKSIKPDARDAARVTMVFEVEPAALLDSTSIALVDGKDEVPLDQHDKHDRGNERTVTLQLPYGRRKLRVQAVDAQARIAAVTEDISVLQRPVLVQLDRLEWPGEGRVDLTPTGRPGVPVAGVVAHGHINWDQASLAAVGRREVYVRVWVNAFLEPAQKISVPARPEKSEFSVPLVLSLPHGNRLIVQLTDVTADRPEYSVDCQEPDRTQELDVVVVDRKDQPQLLHDEIAKAFDIGGRANAFAKVSLTRLLDSQATSMQVNDALSEFQWHAEGPKQTHHVFLFYYRGRELAPKESQEPAATDRSSFVLETLDPAGLPSRELANVFDNLNGANLVFLDVERSGTRDGAPQRWDPPTLGLVRGVLQHPAKTLAAYLAAVATAHAGEHELTMGDWTQRLSTALKQDATQSDATQFDVVESIVGKPIEKVIVRTR
jgi:hypothetical protein